MFKSFFKMLGIIILVKLGFAFISSVNPSMSTHDENQSCKAFNSIGLAKNSNEFSKTRFTKKQHAMFIPIFANYIGDLENGVHGEEGKEAILLMQNSEQTVFVTSNTLSMSRHDCLLDQQKSLNEVVINNLNTTFIETFKRNLREVREKFKLVNESLPTSVDNATNLVAVSVKKNATVEYDLKMKNVSFNQTNEVSRKDFLNALGNQIRKDVCNGESVQSDMMGYTVIYSYYSNDGKLIGRFNLRDIKLNKC